MLIYNWGKPSKALLSQLDEWVNRPIFQSEWVERDDASLHIHERPNWSLYVHLEVVEHDNVLPHVLYLSYRQYE